MEKTNILFLITYINKGGPSKVVRNIVKNIDSNRFNAFVLSLIDKNDDTLIEEMRSWNAKIICMDGKGYADAYFRIRDQVSEILAENKIDIINCHGFLADCLSPFFREKCFVVATIHNNPYEDYVNKHGLLMGRIMIAIHVSALKKMHEVVCCSESVKIVLEKQIKCLTYIRNGLEKHDVKGYDIRKMYGLPKDAYIYIYVGHMSKEKRVLELIRIFNEVHQSNEYLLMLGKGKMLSKCKRAAIENVIFTGWKDDPFSFMKDANAYISFSKSEGFSTSIIEALECGLSMVLSDIPSHREVFSIYCNTYIGELINKSNYNQRFKQFRNKRNTISACEIREIKEKYLSMEHMTTEYESLFESLVVD